MGRQGKGRRGLEVLGWVVVIALSSGCAARGFQPSASHPEVPRISNFRIEPPEVDNGAQVALRFDFRDLDGDIMDVYLGVSSEIENFTLATGLRPVVISRGRYFGRRKGTVGETIQVSFNPAPPLFLRHELDGRVEEPGVPEESLGGIRVYEVFVVDRQGHVSNHLRAQVTVSPNSADARTDGRPGGVAWLETNGGKR